MLNRSEGREWKPTEHSGVDRALFRYNDTGGRSSFVRLKKGSRVASYGHLGTEEVVVISGQVLLGGVAMNEGDYLFTTPGEEHDVVAITDAVIFVSSQKAPPPLK